MRSTFIILLTLSVVSNSAVAEPARPALTGTWKITVFQDDGRDRLDRLGVQTKKGRPPRIAKLVFTEQECWVIRGDGTRELKAGLANAAWKSWEVDQSQTPPTITLKGYSGKDGTKTKTYVGIYELKGDQLTICYNEQGNTRPTKLVSDGAMNLFVCERISEDIEKPQE